jgi:transcription-repair coupling factor (superfamily II helicase)
MIHPSVRDLFGSLRSHPAFRDLARKLTAEQPGTLTLSGLTTTAKAIYLVLLWQATERPLLLIVDGNKQAETMWELVETFYDLLIPAGEGPRPQMIPALDVLPGQNLSPHSEIAEQRAICPDKTCRLTAKLPNSGLSASGGSLRGASHLPSRRSPLRC